jgi:hypothetical protein
MINNNFTIFVLLNSVLFSSSFDNFTHSNPNIAPPPPPEIPPTAAELPEPTGLYSGIPPLPTYNFLGLGVGFGVSFDVGVGVGFANAEGGIGSGIPSALIDH